ncbi:MAG: nucleotidyltransferase domain-containing protein [Nanoarchaeota archaeon]|nr:nucleotidyltransferase domain-containing protein [Nanoarchaeota archaeon]
MLDHIFSNKTNIRILRFLTKFDNQFFSIEEIAKEIGAGLKNVYDSLKILHYEGTLTRKTATDKMYYKFIIDSPITRSIAELFKEERKRLPLKTTKFYKILSEIELKIIKIAGKNLVDIFLFGSISKGRDTPKSDIDLCVLIEKHNPRIEQKIKSLSFENNYSNEIQFHIFTINEFIPAVRKKQNPLIKNIVRDGLSLKIGR